MKNRMVNTRFWQDSYVSNLDPIEKLLFLYCLTNNYSTLCGIYELPLKLMSAETGIDKDMIEKIFIRFEKAEKIAYKDGWVVVKNFIKHHEQGSPKIKIGIEKDLENVPLWAKNFVFGKGIDTLSPLASTLASTSTFNSEQSSHSRKVVKKEKPIKEENTEEPFILIREIEKLEENDRRDLNIIALYFRQRKTQLQNKEQFQTAVRRHIRSAKELIPFTDDQLIKACTRAKSEYPDIWTLETLIKILTK